MAAEMSVFDILLDRHDPSMPLDIKQEQSESRQDILDMAMRDSDMDWPDPCDDFLNSILHGEQLDDTPLLDPLEDMLHEDPICDPDFGITSSAASDSGLSSEMSLDQQLSPVPLGLSPLPPSSDGNSDSESSSTMDCASLGDVQVQESQPVINMKLVNTQDSNNQRVRRVIRLTPVTSSSDSTNTLNNNNSKTRSILLPVSSLKGGQNLRTIRIISTANGARLPAGLRVVCSKPPSPPVQAPALSSTTEKSSSEVPSDTASEDSDSPPYPRLDLSNEEKRLLKKEGITLPTHYPLTKLEERELKRIRRKIRNKISAQDSRKRKKEYVDGLEDRVRRCTDENASLLKRVKALQGQNTSLSAQVKRLQNMLAQGGANRQVQPATCLMVLLLSLALVVMPNMRPGQNNSSTTALDEGNTSPDLTLPSDKLPPVAGRSRTLLYKYPVCSEELPFSVEGEEVAEELCSLTEHDYEPPSKIARGERGSQARESFKPLEYLDVDDIWPPPKAPPDVTQHNKITSSLDGRWPINSHLAKELDKMIDDKPNSTVDFQETRTVLLKIPTEK